MTTQPQSPEPGMKDAPGANRAAGIDILTRVAQALDGVTPGPWDHSEAFNASFVSAGDRTVSVSQSWIARLDNRPGRRQDKIDARFIAEARTLVPELAAELKVTRAELALTRDGYQVRPMTETESNLMTQVLDLRRERAESKAEVERLRGALERVNALADEWISIGGAPHGALGSALRAVLRGDQ